MPKTAGNDDAFKVYDPARVSHLPVRQSVRHPGGVVRSLVMADPRVEGRSPEDPWLKSGHPQGVLRPPLLQDEMNGFCATRVRYPPEIRECVVPAPCLAIGRQQISV